MFNTMNIGGWICLSPDKEFFQDVLNIYDQLTKLHFVLCSKDGSIIVHSINNRESYLFELLQYEHKTWEQLLKQWTHDFSIIRRPMLFDSFPGIKCIVSPIFLDNGPEYFIFAGSLIEYSSRKLIQTFLEKIMSPEKVISSLAMINEVSLNQIEEHLKKVEKLTSLLKVWLLTQKEKSKIDSEKKRINKILQLAAAENVTVTDMLEYLYQSSRTIDFVGYAKKKNLDQYVIKECVTSVDCSLNGTEFSTGEGVLGQVVALQTAQIRDNFDYDSRKLFFQERGILPKSIFIFPLISKQDVTGLIFGGSCSERHLGKQVLFEGKLIASYIKKIEYRNTWKNQVINLSIKNTAINQLLQSLMLATDRKTIQHLLLDSILNIVHGPFASVILMRDSGESFDIVSRGLTVEQLDDYINDATRDFHNNCQTFQKRNYQHAGCCRDINSRVLELPIVYQDTCFGILSVGYNDKSFNEEDVSFFKSITNAGGLALSLLDPSKMLKDDKMHTEVPDGGADLKIGKHLNLSKREIDVVKLVLKGCNNREISESLFISEHTVKNHITKIFQKIDVTDRSQLMAKIYQEGFQSEDTF